MYRHLLYIVGCIAVFFGFPENIASQTTNSNTLKRMLEDVERRKLVINQHALDISSLCPDKSAYVCYDKLIVTDMGIRLFPDAVKQSNLTPVVYDFVERYLLSLLLRSTKTEQIYLLREDFCQLKINGTAFKQSKYTMPNVLKAIQPDSRLNIQNDSLSFSFSWNQKDSKRPEITFVFPKQYDLIHGKDKKEIVHYLYDELSEFNQYAVFDSTDILSATYRADKNIYSFIGDFYLIPQVQSGIHLSKKDSTISYLLNERFGEESLLNLFGHAYQMDYPNPLELEIKGYKFSQVLPYTLKRLTAYMRSQYYRVYIGIEEENKEEYIGTAFYINRDLMCKHLLYFHFPKKAFKQRGIPIRAVLYPYIPIQNIGTLYDSDTKTESKQTIQIM